jgi:alkylation response protein AidB-like acyl-CoA dehydrogenase
MTASRQPTQSVDLIFSADQEEFGAGVRRLLDNHSKSADVRRVVETASGHDYELWHRLVAQAGVAEIGVAEQHGGSGASLTDVIVVSAEMGRALACTPFFATTILAVSALLATDDAVAQADLLPLLASGEVTATFWPGAIGGIAASASSGTVRAEAAGEAWALSGTANFVIDGATAALLVVAASVEESVALFVVDTRVPDVEATLRRQPRAVLDATRRVAEVDFGQTPARLLGDLASGSGYVSAAMNRVVTALAAEQAAGAERCLEQTVAYVKERIQFGRPVGSFQAVKHRCADILLKVDAASAAAHYAAWTADNLVEQFPLAAAIAAEAATEAYLFASRECLHLHGGIGFTWEHDSHLYFRRARGTAALFGDGNYYRELVAQRFDL